tara:strand:+ start:350 stop:1078 length:729 start_codon:yes stop_codon:yes gene_type:complete
MGHITEMPMEILTYIISLVESVNLYKEQYIEIANNGKPYFVKKNKNRTVGRDDSITQVFRYKLRAFRNSSEIKLLPAHLSSLSMVSTSFNKSCMPLWEHIYILHFRKGIPFKRNHSPEFYRKKYLAYIKQYYTDIIDKMKKLLLFSETMLIIKNNNSSIYLRYIQEAVDTQTIDNPKKIYNVKDLLVYRDLDINPDSIILPLRIDRLISHRQKAVYEIGHYTTKSNRMKTKIETVEKIISGL